MDKQMFVVRTGLGTCSGVQDSAHPEKGFTDSVEMVIRTPRQHLGWQSVRYKNNRYQLYGGSHTFWFICLNSPIKSSK